VLTTNLELTRFTTRDVTEPAKIRIHCGFHVQNRSEADADLSRDHHYQLLWLLRFNLHKRKQLQTAANNVVAIQSYFCCNMTNIHNGRDLFWQQFGKLPSSTLLNSLNSVSS